MNTSSLKQGTPEWRAARVGRITASGVASVLGVSPFATTKAYLKRMVDEALNGPVEVNAPPLRWGVDNEGKARAIY